MVAISVTIPVYNAERYLRQAVESALGQTGVAQAILADDGSTDGSLALAHQLAAEDPRVEVVRHPDGANHGVGATRNLTLQAVRFPWVAFLDADNYFEAGAFDFLMAHLRAHPDLDGTFANVRIFTEASFDSSLGRSFDGVSTTMSTTLPPEALFRALVLRSHKAFSMNTLLVRYSALARAGVFSPNLRVGEDSALLLKLTAVGRLAAADLERVVVTQRWHGANLLGGRQVSAAQKYRNRLAAYEQVWDWGQASPEPPQQQLLLWRIVQDKLRLGELEEQPAARVRRAIRAWLRERCPYPEHRQQARAWLTYGAPPPAPPQLSERA
ncbi:MAG: glycosyltransferase family 2 protein [Anaerolineae bacterium]|nr:glycosyltransferase family 2 protein [Anaerolineae bacterium]